MSRDLGDLIFDFRDRVIDLLDRCKESGYEMIPFYTERDVFDQARLWRQSRPKWMIDKEIKKLRDNDADFLAEVIETVGSQSGVWKTNAIPGLSWHQHGKAIDCYWKVDGEAEWSSNKLIDGKNGYQVYSDIAEDLKLTSGCNWSNPDCVHVQWHHSSVLSVYPIQEVNNIMRERYDR